MRAQIDAVGLRQLLVSVFTLREDQLDAVAHRIALLRRTDCPAGAIGAKQGNITRYSLRETCQVALAFALIDAGVSTKDAGKVVVMQWDVCAASYAGSQDTGDGRGDWRWLSAGGIGLSAMKGSPPRNQPVLVMARSGVDRLLGGRRQGEGAVSAITVDIYRLSHRLTLAFAQVANVPLEDVRAALAKLAD